MILDKYYINCEESFLMYLLSSKISKSIAKEFEFYNVKFVKDNNYTAKLTVYLEYPKFNPYWYFDFKKYVTNELNIDIYKKEWEYLLYQLEAKLQSELRYLNLCYTQIYEGSKIVLNDMFEYNLRAYQAKDLEILNFKMQTMSEYKAGLILSEPRTGKSRIAIAYAFKYLINFSTLIVCPKISINGWKNEIEEVSKYIGIDTTVNILEHTSNISKIEYNLSNRVFNIISYDLFKRLTKTQIKQIIGYKKVAEFLLIVDELHRLRNFKTQQSKALFDFKDFIFNNYDKDSFNIIGITGTPAVKDSYDVFGILSFINFSHIGFQPYYKDFNQFKEYFYNCEDTSYGKIVKTLKRQDELKYIVGLSAVQTIQKDLNIFKNYTKKYKRIDLQMDSLQQAYYDNIDEYMEYENIDCKNTLTKYTRLQQICNDPSSLFPTYEPIAPKIKFILKFVKLNKNIKSLIISKSVKMLDSIAHHLELNNINYGYINGSKDLKIRNVEIDKFKTSANVMLLQLDTCKESLTLPEADCTIFTDRSFVQGFNEQAEARMTPFSTIPVTKYIFDLVMKNTIEEKIYNILVYKKQNIKDVNILF